MKLAKPTMASNYSLEDTLVEGAYGNTYSATRLCVMKNIAITTHVRQKGDEKTALRADWKNELDELMKVCGHDNVVEYQNFFVAVNKKLWIEMEHCNGGTLNDYVIRVTPSRNIKHKFMVEISSGVAFLHNKGIIHHDLTPESIMVCTDPDRPPSIKITDFGLTKMVASCNFRGKLQQYYLYAGFLTKYFMAPEVYNEKYTEKGDIFSIGVIFLSIVPSLSLHWLYDGKDYLIKRHNEDPIGKVMLDTKADVDCTESVADNISKGVKNLLDSMITYDHSGRPSAQEVNTILKSIEAKELCLVEEALPEPSEESTCPIL